MKRCRIAYRPRKAYRYTLLLCAEADCRKSWRYISSLTPGGCVPHKSLWWSVVFIEILRYHSRLASGKKNLFMWMRPLTIGMLRLRLIASNKLSDWRPALSCINFAPIEHNRLSWAWSVRVCVGNPLIAVVNGIFRMLDNWPSFLLFTEELFNAHRNLLEFSCSC